MSITKQTKTIVFDDNVLEVSGVLVINEDSTKEFEIDSVIYTNNDITSLLESINAFYVKSRLTSLRNPDEKTLDIWDEIEKLMLE